MMQQQQIQEYYDSPALNQSLFKTLIWGPYGFQGIQDEKTLYYEEKGHFIIGTGVDIITTQSQQAFDEQYFYQDVKKPGQTVMAFIQELFDNCSKEKGLKIKDIKSEIPKLSGFKDYGNYSEAKRVERIINYGEAYFNSLIESDGKQVIDPVEGKLIVDIVKSFTTNPRTRKYFVKQEQLPSHLEIKNQLPIYFKFKGHDCKALLDKTLFDHRQKKIYPLDVKTTMEYTSNFIKAYRQRRYDIQGEWYTQALESAYPDYQIQPFEFVVESTKKVGQPLVYAMDSEAREVAMNGIPSGTFGGLVTDEVCGINELFRRYEWYLENGFSEDIFIATKQRSININWFKTH